MQGEVQRRGAIGWRDGQPSDGNAEPRRLMTVSGRAASGTGEFNPSLPLAFRIARLFQQPVEAIFENSEDV